MADGGSQQQRQYRRARRDGVTMTTAAVLSGLSLGEARLLEAADANSPPGPECFELLTTAPDPALHTKEDDMARPRKQPEVEQVHAPDYALAVRIYRQDIKPAQSKVGEYAQEQSTAYKAIKKNAHIQPGAAKLAFKLDEMEESKLDDFLRSLNGLLKALNIFMPADLVDAAEGKSNVGDAVIPIGDRKRPQLATVPVSDGIDADLAGDDDTHAEAAE